MVEIHQTSGTAYRAKLSQVVQRATELELHARAEYRALSADHPERAPWLRIERRYATIRGNAEHLLIIHERQQTRRQPLYRLRRYLHLL